ncbi:hypothetical protein HanRHA438_Chr01g0038751 [Helianthus annuus]|nr:hypothetical protein HanRHA438_Chr01g0038751 [Helianthus annuus]
MFVSSSFLLILSNNFILVMENEQARYQGVNIDLFFHDFIEQNYLMYSFC